VIQLFQPQVGEREAAAVAEVMAGRWLGHGPRTAAFEAEFAAHLGVPAEQVLFTASGTAALFLAVESLGLAAGDEVVLPSVSFVAAANAVLSVGARPVFCDVGRRTLNPTLEDVAAAVTPRTRAVVVLHYGGAPGDVARIAPWCRERGIALVEDCACSVASSVDGRPAGTFGDAAMWSFDAAKVLTTGDGGMLLIRDPERMALARRLAYHGLAHLSGQSGARTLTRWWSLDVAAPARRVIGNDLTAAIGSVQLSRLDELVARRRGIVALYDRDLAGDVRTPPPLPAGHVSTHYFYWVQIPDRDAVAHALLDAGIYTTFRYAPLHTVGLYGFTGELPETDALARDTLCLPLHPGLTDADVTTVTTTLRRLLGLTRRT
jgi:dTDP-4-dehydro-2,3,6-trideoxy-D-glucose 4-aminotransferase